MRRYKTCRKSPRSGLGFTLLEVLVSISIIGLLIAITAPAIQQSRATARRMQCSSYLRQIGIAAHAYEETHGQLPHVHLAAGLLFTLLPYLDQQAEHARLEKLLTGSFAEHLEAFTTTKRLACYLCPDDVLATEGASSSYDVNEGLFDMTGQQRAFVSYAQSKLAWRDVTDGLSQTALCSEMRNGPLIEPGMPPNPLYASWLVNSPVMFGAVTHSELVQFASNCVTASQTTPPYVPFGSAPYIASNSGYNHVGPPNSPACETGGVLFSRPASSNHSGGVNLLLADGSVKFIATSIDIEIWRALGSRDGGEALSSSF